MSVIVPPTPSHEAAADVIEKLARITNKEVSNEVIQTANGHPQILLALSCVLSVIGILLLICTLVIMCVPESLLGRLIVLVCQTMF